MTSVAVLTPAEVQALAADAYSAGYLRAQSELETDLLTVAQVQQRLDWASPAPVYDRIRAGKLKALKIGDEYRIRLSAFRAFLAECEAGESASPMTHALVNAAPAASSCATSHPSAAVRRAARP